MNNERLLEVLKTDLKCQRIDMDGSCFRYHNSCEPRISFIHHQSENTGCELADIRLSLCRLLLVTVLFLSMVVYRIGLKVIIGIVEVGCLMTSTISYSLQI